MLPIITHKNSLALAGGEARAIQRLFVVPRIRLEPRVGSPFRFQVGHAGRTSCAGAASPAVHGDGTDNTCCATVLYCSARCSGRPPYRQHPGAVPYSRTIGLRIRERVPRQGNRNLRVELTAGNPYKFAVGLPMYIFFFNDSQEHCSVTFTYGEEECFVVTEFVITI